MDITYTSEWDAKRYERVIDASLRVTGPFGNSRDTPRQDSSHFSGVCPREFKAEYGLVPVMTCAGVVFLVILLAPIGM